MFGRVSKREAREAFEDVVLFFNLLGHLEVYINQRVKRDARDFALHARDELDKLYYGHYAISETTYKEIYQKLTDCADVIYDEQWYVAMDIFSEIILSTDKLKDEVLDYLYEHRYQK